MELEPEVIIQEMPSKELLQEYLRGLFRGVTVVFDVEEGKFRRVGDNV